MVCQSFERWNQHRGMESTSAHQCHPTAGGPDVLPNPMSAPDPEPPEPDPAPEPSPVPPVPEPAPCLGAGSVGEVVETVAKHRGRVQVVGRRSSVTEAER